MSFNPIYPYDLNELPPKFDFTDQEILTWLLKAKPNLTELKGYCYAMPNPLLLLSPAILREAVASSNIENINTTIIDVLQNQLFPEAEQREVDKEVLRYNEAIYWGFENLESFSLSTRLILGVYKKLLPNSHSEFRKQQNAIVNKLTNEILYTPPIASNIPRLIANWENFVNNPNKIDPLIKAIVAHYQFEAIHPFGDGNGRVGRILMVLQLIKYGLLKWPILYISGYINQNRNEYYRYLRGVTAENNWRDYIVFMLKGFHLQTEETIDTLFKIMGLYESTKQKIKEEHKKIYTADLVEKLFAYPIITPVKLAEELGIHYTTASKYLVNLVKSDILGETKAGKYHLFLNKKLIEVIRK